MPNKPLKRAVEIAETLKIRESPEFIASYAAMQISDAVRPLRDAARALKNAQPDSQDWYAAEIELAAVLKQWEDCE